MLKNAEYVGKKQILLYPFTRRSNSCFSSRVLILCLCFMSIPSALHGFWFSVCVSYLFLQHFTGSDSLFVFYVYSFSSSRILIFCLCFISIPSALHGFWLSICVLFSPNQPLMGSDSLVVFYIYQISPSRVLILCLCFTSIPSVLHGFWFSSHHQQQQPQDRWNSTQNTINVNKKTLTKRTNSH
jgi:hypothetical protein